MEDQILYADSMEEVTSDANLFKKLLKKEQRLLARLQEEQEAEARAQDRFQRAKSRLQRRRKRLERIQGKLVHVREQLTELHITDQQPVYIVHERVIDATQESTTSVASEEDTLVQSEQNNEVTHETDELSPAYAESPILDTSVPEQENTSINMDVSDVPVTHNDEEKTNEQGHPATEQETTSPTPFTYEPIEAIVESEPGTTPEERSDEELFEQQQEPATAIDAIAVEPEAWVRNVVDISLETNSERKPTKPLRLDHAGLAAAELLSPDVQSAKEAWIAAESAMQNARNATHGIAASITFLSQTDGLSNEFMEELVQKQADANKELLKAQDAARAAYERFVQAQRDAEPAARVSLDASMNTAEDHSQQKQEQEDVSLPPAEENGVDQTAKLHAVRLYKEW